MTNSVIAHPGAIPPQPLPCRSSRPFTILLRSGWQSANIGDIAHTPGVLRTFEHHAPEVEFILWPGVFDRGVEQMLRKRFPRVRMVRDAAKWRPPEPQPGDCRLAEAFERADLLLHGSGPGMVGAAEIEQWRAATGKPWGAFGVTVGSNVGVIDTSPDFPPALTKLLNSAAFFYARETRSLEAARRAGVSVPLAFCPDATFALDNLRDEASADALLAAHRLERDRFLCVIPRLRLTPYWKMHHVRDYSSEETSTNEKFNAVHAVTDLAVVREAVIHWVRTTGQRVLLCPEMSYENELFKPYILSKLPEDVKPHVSALDRYWITDEASSVYARASLVLSMECHSPILAIAAGKPAIYLHQPQDTWKMQMYPDLGLDDWIFPIGEAGGGRLAARLTEIHQNRPAALALAQTAQRRAATLLGNAVRQVLQLTAPPPAATK